jgi:hypothetical protein
MTSTHTKKTRNKTVLPITFADGEVIADLPIQELVTRKGVWEENVASHEQTKLELRAINAAIRAKAR